MKIAIIGYGYWGPNLVRNFNNTSGCEVACIYDLSPNQLEKAYKAWPNIPRHSDYQKVLQDKTIDAVAIATPVFSHFELAEAALKAGKHVLIEKPMTASVKEAETLVQMAKELGKVLMVDHTYLYTSAVQAIKGIVDEGSIGKIKYIDSTRINLGLFQSDVNVLWDLAPHDISICNYLMKESPVAVQAIGVSHTHNQLENIAYLTLFYSENKIAHFNCSWVSPVKIRQMLIGGDKKMILFNDLETTEKVKIYDKGYSILSSEDRDKTLIDYRIGDITIPKIPQGEALAEMAKDFVSAITKGTTPRSDGQNGLDIVAILEAATYSIKNEGQLIKVNALT